MKAVLFTVTLAAAAALAAPAPAATPTGFVAVLPHYEAIHAALAGDSIKDVANPYFGSKMLKCGKVVSK